MGWYTETMATPVDELYEQASDLPPNERAALTGLLVDTLEGAVDPDVERAWRQEVTRRVEELDSGAAQTVPWEQVREKLRKICGGL
ncbi:MAG TPA: addiction module protein [Pyrinomonadaceae bacterium]|nr:addiction module protein [Pyrinomonadaceae bacterium]